MTTRNRPTKQTKQPQRSPTSPSSDEQLEQLRGDDQLEQLDGVAIGHELAARAQTPAGPVGPPPTDANGEPVDRCARCGETEGEYREIRETPIGGRRRDSGRAYVRVSWGVVICAGCGQRRARKIYHSDPAEPDAAAAAE